MPLETHFTRTSLYRVEVSGWDHEQAFFVEKAELEWSEESGKQLALGHSLSEGAVVFVRLLQPTSIERASAVAYKTQGNGTKKEGQFSFLLKPVQPLAADDRPDEPR